jgi:DNA-binding MarR family transcriptional regulator
VSDAPPRDPLVIALFGEIVMIEQIARTRLSKALPRGMELSHFMVLSHFARLGGEQTPAQLARAFHVTKGAMSNTVQKLDAAGYVHIRPDWDDARKKWVSISPAGERARDRAARAVAPVFDDLLARIGAPELQAMLPKLTALHRALGQG